MIAKLQERFPAPAHARPRLVWMCLGGNGVGGGESSPKVESSDGWNILKFRPRKNQKAGTTAKVESAKGNGTR